MTETTTENGAFSISDAAAARIADLLKEEEKGARLRVAIQGGGCSGFQYTFDFDTSKENDDLLFRHGEVEVVIDPASLDMLKGGVLDYVETLGASHFQITNPNATASCGCGSSFSVM